MLEKTILCEGVDADADGFERLRMVSRGPVEAARTKMTFWIVFTVAMLGLLVFKIARAAKTKRNEAEPPPEIPTARVVDDERVE